MTTFGVHYKALMRKNYTLWKRNKCGSCCEIVVPVLLALLFFVFRSATSRDTIAEHSYINEQTTLFSQPPSVAADINAMGMQNCWTRSYQDSPRYRTGNVALMPDNPLTQALKTKMSLFTGKSGQTFTFSMFNSLDEFNTYITGPNYKYDVCFGINIVQESALNYSTTIMYNTTANRDPDIPDTTGEEVLDYKPQNAEDFYKPYIDSGFLQVKNWIDNTILQQLIPAASIQPTITPLKQKEYIKDKISDILKDNMSTFLVLPLIVVFLRMSSSILTEKENKIREGMKIMGMQDASFYLSWISWYMIIYTIVSILVTLILVGSVYKNSNVILIFVWHWLFSMTLIAQSLFITAFFTNAKLGNIVSMVFFLVMFLFKFIVSGSSNVSEGTNSAISLASQSNMSISSNVFLLVEAEGVGIGWGDLAKLIDNASIGTSLGLYILNYVVFMVLALYFDQVIPNDFGKKKHPLFFVTWMCKRRNETPLNFSEDEDKSNLLIKNNIEDVAAGLRIQEKANEVLKLSDIYRVYGNGKKAVNGISLTMYNSQIFCLLGHNGAGKTSLISMLTGMLEFSSGSAVVYGKDIKTEMMDIRKFMGVCPQHDILFDYISVKEHLELFAAFKGMAAKDIPEAVEQAIHDVDLQEKKNELSKNLSGGQRRRLSVAIAFIGGSKLIYLDEPTSGMDTSARRHIWDMLKKYKNEKIIVLTTHFMDEADYLGDRIGIMGDGRLICCGSSVFLKNRFGVGYNLSISKKSTEIPSAPIINLVNSFVPDGNKISDVSQEIAFQLPISSVGKFESLFTQMDAQKESLGIASYGISITTLEEVFLKVAHTNSTEKTNIAPSDISKAVQTAKVSPQNSNNDKHEEALAIPMIQEDAQVDNFDLNSVRIKKPIYLFFSHFFSLIVKRALYFKRDKRGFICEVFLPCAVVVGGLSLLLISFISNAPALIITDNYYGNALSVYWGADTAVTPTDATNLIAKLSSSIVPTQISTTDISVWDQKNFNDRDLARKGSYWLLSTTSNNFKYYTQVQTISRCSPLYFLNEMNQAIIRQATGSNIVLKLTNMPLRLTQKTMDLQSTSNGIISSFMFSIGLAFIPASIITFIVKERTSMVKHQHLVSGVSLLSYWTSSFTLDFIKHFVPAFFCMLMVLAYSITTFTDHGSDYAAISILFFLYGWAIIPFSYLTGFIFADYGSAQVTNFFIHFILGGIGPLTIFILRIINSTANIGLGIGWILRLIPSFSFGYGVLNIGNRSLYAQKDDLDQPYNTFDMNIAGGDVLFLALEGVCYMLLIFLYENLSHRKGFSEIISGENKVAYVPKEYDDDVQREMDTIAKSSPSEYTVRVKDLRKVFIPQKDRIKVAVDRISFGIKSGEVFTLLGVNGAGKTTTFKILSGEIKPTSGEAHIAGYSVLDDLDNARMNIGYCPQFDALLDNLTAREHLNLYAAIKGIPNELRDRLVQKKLQEMDLIQFEGILAGTFSGGNKRKLSVAIAMLGQPSIIFLDEPSTGMDPGARRFMWNVISRISIVNKSSSVILTTHSMEEAEALSSRMAIQVDGSLQCIGTTQEIKHKFGKGYEVEVKVQKPTVEELQALAKKAGLPNTQAHIFPQDLMNILIKLENPELFSTIAEGQTGYILYKEMNSPKGLLAEVLLEYVLIETLGNKIMSFLNQSFGSFDIIEHLSDFYRFRIDTSISIGKIFGQFESHKQGLKISEYSLKQATIEQIFNMFAEGKIGVNEHLKQNVIRKNSYAQNLKRNSVSQQPQVSNTNKGLNNLSNNQKENITASDIEMQQMPNQIQKQPHQKRKHQEE